MMRLHKRVLWLESVFHSALIAWYFCFMMKSIVHAHSTKPTVGHNLKAIVKTFLASIKYIHLAKYVDLLVIYF